MLPILASRILNEITHKRLDMRTRKEILDIKDKQRPVVNPNFDMAEVLEVLLDIRDLLTPPSV